MLDMINLGYIEMEHPKEEHCQGSYIDLSQGPDYVALNPRGMQCLFGNSLVFSYQFRCILTGVHMCADHGFPVKECRFYDYKNGLPRALAGDSNFLPCFAAIDAACFLNIQAPWWKKSLKRNHRDSSVASSKQPRVA